MGPGGAKALAGQENNVRNFVTAGGHLLLLAQTEDEANAILPFKVTMKKDEHISTTFARADRDSALAGVAPADVYARNAKEIPLVTGGALPVGDGVLAVSADGNVVFRQLVPWRYDYNAFNGGAWQIYYKMHNIKWTFQRTSFLLGRLLGNMGVGAGTPLLAQFGKPAMEGDSLQNLSHCSSR